MIVFAISIFMMVFSMAHPLTHNAISKETTFSVLPVKIEILKQINHVYDDGSYTFGYEASDGSFRVEHKDVTGYVTGKFGYVDVDGRIQVSEYTAGTDVAGRSLGFQTSDTRLSPLISGVGTTDPMLRSRGNTELALEVETAEIQPQTRIGPQAASVSEQPKLFQFGQALFRSSSNEAVQAGADFQQLTPSRIDKFTQNIAY